MINLEITRHPVKLIGSLAENLDGNARLSFSKYRYEPQTLQDIRTNFEVPIGDVCDKWLIEQLNSLAAEEDLAFNSTVHTDTGIFHVPMVDFMGLGVDHVRGLVAVFGESVRDDFVFCSSGRSFHAYGVTKILSEVEWVDFMVKLLLCNLPGKAAVVDSRWVAHRLLGRYSALRWSKNSSRYKSYPTIIDDMNSISGLTKRRKKIMLSSGLDK
jgi:hypothetical protein